jgi:hypothetical protein
MSFELMNTSATFQRAMDYYYHDLIGKMMVDYQNDLTIYSNVREQDVFHIKEFLSCRMYRIFIKPPKIVVFYHILN